LAATRSWQRAVRIEPQLEAANVITDVIWLVVVRLLARERIVERLCLFCVVDPVNECLKCFKHNGIGAYEMMGKYTAEIGTGLPNVPYLSGPGGLAGNERQNAAV